MNSMREWESEPNRKHWIDTDSGLDCLIVRNLSLTLCGYVGVPVGHPWYGLDYDDVEAEVHGGLTYAGLCEDHICHDAATEPVANVEVWWLGFDCGHLFDLIPAMQEIRKAMANRFAILEGMPLPETYRNMAYVEAECRSLAAQARQAMVRNEP